MRLRVLLRDSIVNESVPFCSCRLSLIPDNTALLSSMELPLPLQFSLRLFVLVQ